MKTRSERQIERRGGESESTVEGQPNESQSEQYSLAKILGIWAAAALPMAALAWVVAPLVAGWLGGPVPLARALLASLTVGLVWQFVLVLFLVYRERTSVRWSVLRDALWLRAPRNPTTGRVGGWLWLVLIPALLIFLSEEFIPSFSPVLGHDFAAFAQSDAGAAFLSGNWSWYALIFALALFNTVLGEELLFRGVLLAADARRLRPLGLGCQRRPVRRLPPAHAVGDPGGLARHLRTILPVAALPQRTDRDRRAQLPERLDPRSRLVPGPQVASAPG